MPLTVTRGNPWGVPASIRVLSKRYSPALAPLREAIRRKCDFVVAWNRARGHMNHNGIHDHRSAQLPPIIVIRGARPSPPQADLNCKPTFWSPRSSLSARVRKVERIVVLHREREKVRERKRERKKRLIASNQLRTGREHVAHSKLSLMAL